MRDAVVLRNLTLGYDRHPAVHHLDGRIAAGELLAIVGPNGAGKSTLLRGIAGLLRPLEGKVDIAPELRGRIGYLPQVAAIDRTFPINVADFVSLGLWREVGFLGRIRGDLAARVERALDDVGLAGYERRPLDTLSGGQLARALFARLVVQKADLLLLDEPFAAIDRPTTEALCSLLETWHRAGRTVLAVVHDLEQVRAHFPRTLLMAREALAWGATGEVLEAARKHAFEPQMAAFDDQARWCAGPAPRSSLGHAA